MSKHVCLSDFSAFLLALSCGRNWTFSYATSLTISYYGFSKWLGAWFIILYCILKNNFLHSLKNRKTLNDYLCKSVPIGLQANFYYLKRVDHDGFC